MWGAIAGAAIQAGASLLGNKASAKSVKKQMEFQERMSNTAHQREIADLKAAGLNPILSASNSGASTPSGASYTAQVPDLTGAYNQSSSTAADVSTKKTQRNKMRTEMDAVNASAKATQAAEAKTRYETSTILPAQLAQIQSQTALQNANSAAAAASVDYTKSRVAGQYITNQLQDLELNKSQTTKAGYNVFGDLVNKASNWAKGYIDENYGSSAKMKSQLPDFHPLDNLKNKIRTTNRVPE